MFPSKNPLICILAIVGIVLAIITTIVFTGNALALFALVLVQLFIPPLVGPSQEDTDATGGIGFTADVDGDRE